MRTVNNNIPQGIDFFDVQHPARGPHVALKTSERKPDSIVSPFWLSIQRYGAAPAGSDMEVGLEGTEDEKCLQRVQR